MTEETNTDGEKEEAKKPEPEDAGTGIVKETGSLIDRADANIKRMEELDKSIGEKVAYLQAREARDKLGGTANAGVEKPAETMEDKAKLLADEMLKSFQ